MSFFVPVLFFIFYKKRTTIILSQTLPCITSFILHDPFQLSSLITLPLIAEAPFQQYHISWHQRKREKNFKEDKCHFPPLFEWRVGLGSPQVAAFLASRHHWGVYFRDMKLVLERAPSNPIEKFKPLSLPYLKKLSCANWRILLNRTSHPLRLIRFKVTPLTSHVYLSRCSSP